MGFTDSQIKQESWITFTWEGKERRKRIDVIGENSSRKVLFQVGNHSEFEISLLRKFFETIYLQYNEEYEDDLTIKEEEEIELRDEKNILIATYNKIEKLFENDEVYDFIKYDVTTANVFKLGKNDAWMIIPTSKTLSKDEFFHHITLTISYLEKGQFAIGLYAIQKEAVETFLNISEEEKQRYVKEFRTLPTGYFVFTGYRRPEKHPLNWIQYWQEEDYWLDPVVFNYSKLCELEEDAELLLEAGFKELPCLCLLYTKVAENDLIKALHKIRPVYSCIKTLKSFEKQIKEKVKGLTLWAWHIYENKIPDLYELFSEKNHEDKISYEDFKSIVRLLKKDPEYITYENSDE